MDYTIALAGNPNVGKSTVFNALTGMNQHTGNWAGKTVTCAQGVYTYGRQKNTLVDLPGTYSLIARSAEESAARDFLCFSDPDAVIVVCDATCLERNMNLVLQTLEITGRVVVCVNLMDEASRKGISVDTAVLSKELGVAVVATSARRRAGMQELMKHAQAAAENRDAKPVHITYPHHVEEAIAMIIPVVENMGCAVDTRWAAVRMLEGNDEIFARLGGCSDGVEDAVAAAREYLEDHGIERERICDVMVDAVVDRAENICRKVVSGGSGYDRRDRKIDRVLTGRCTGIPIMLAMLGILFWITVSGANVPSQMLADGLFALGDVFSGALVRAGAPEWLRSLLVDGVYLVPAWVVSVMLPPMAIFFPLFTLLEDAGVLPRIAFNLDKYFKKSGACGKQALTMCMGIGCNCAGIVGCRIIDSPRERLIAIVTNSFVPCNGRFPFLIAVIAMFFTSMNGGLFDSVLSASILLAVVIFGIVMTLICSKMLSRSILHGKSSSFVLELPPYRRPQIGKVIVRSIFDRTLFVLGRAIITAAPAGLIIWGMANFYVGGANAESVSLLTQCAGFLDPFARFLGLDGVILLAFILGFPANEIVLPIMIMTYLSAGAPVDVPGLIPLRELLVANGWTGLTAVCTLLFSLMHWPCSTACLTVKKESGRLGWTAAAMLLPTLCGMAICAVVAVIWRLVA